MTMRYGTTRTAIAATFIIGFLLAGSARAQSLGGGNSTVGTIDQWKATSSPNAMTQRIRNNPILITGLNTGECLTLAPNGLATTTGAACGSGGGGSGNSAWTIGNGLIYNATSTDKVGIGTSTPIFKLSVIGDINGQGNLIQGNQWLSLQPSGFGTGYHMAQFATSSNDVVGVRISNMSGGTTAGTGYILTNDKTTLNVAGLAQSYYGGLFMFGSNFNGAPYGITAVGPNDVGLSNSDGKLVLSAASSTGSIDFYAGNNGYQSGTIDMRLTHLGNLGIGTTTAMARVAIQGTSSAPTTDLFAIASSSRENYVVVKSSGNVGIGTSSPSGTLSVLGRPDVNPFVVASSTGGNMFEVTPSGMVNIVPVFAGSGGNRTLSFGTAFANPAIYLYNAGATTRYGWGMQAGAMQFFAASSTGNVFTWNSGGDLQSTGTNELMRLQQYAAGTGGALTIGGAGGVFAPTTPYKLELDGVSLAGASAGTEDIIRFRRGQTGGVSYPEAFAIGLGRYSSSGVGPDTRVDFKLKSSAATDFSAGTTVMSLNSNGRLGVGTTTVAATLGVTGTSGSTVPNLLIASSSNAVHFAIDSKGHKITGGPVATVSSCGTSPAIAGNDNNGRVTIGTSIGADNTCTVTFSAAWSVAPSCFVNNESRVLLGRAVTTTTTMTFDVAATFTDSDVWNYHCEGY